jgi:adenine phosphoribosyltransferase
MNLLDYLPIVEDFPKPGILFRDISPLLADPAAFKYAIECLSTLFSSLEFTHIEGIETRGLIYGSALSLYCQKPFILIRKPNKLPLATYSETYGLEYGSDSLQIQQSALPKEAKVLMVDDILATGGTILAAAKLIKKAGGKVSGAATIAQINTLDGESFLSKNGINIKTVLAL